MLLQDKVVMISGVGPGLGRKLALRCAAEGARVGLSCRSTDFLQSLEREITDAGGTVFAQPCDITQADQCEALCHGVAARLGAIDGLVNNAYSYAPAPFEGVDLDDWDRMFRIGCLGALRMSQAALPSMRQTGAGSIVNVSTIQVRRPAPGQGGYTIPKAALEMATRQMAVELGRYNIRVNSAAMGWMWGIPVEQGLRGRAEQTGTTVEKMVGEIVAQIPLGCMPTDDQCAGSVLFLLSDYAAAVTGEVLNANGGHNLGL